MNVEKYAAAGPQAIARRLVQLDREWDVERALAANFGIVVLIGVLLGAWVNPLWLILAGVSSTFNLVHAVQGWCPPLPVYRRLGFRTRSEIEVERYALKALRGDFRHLPSLEDDLDRESVARVIRAVYRGGDRARLFELVAAELGMERPQRPGEDPEDS